MGSKNQTEMMVASLPELGWGNDFIQQLSLDEWDDYVPARVIEQHRSQLLVALDNKSVIVAYPVHMDAAITVGDWLLLDHDLAVRRVLDRKTVFQRKASGEKAKTQLIAANVDTVFIVSSLNHDFSLNRIERYLVLANEAKVEPVVVLTKVDLCESEEKREHYVQQVQSLDPYLMVVTVNALDESELSQFSAWCKPGKTMALLGSSGVGKSSLTNLLVGKQVLATAGIREDDSKGRHTTTGRSLNLIPSGDVLAGGLLLDTPGMRELQLANVDEGIEETFSDIIALGQSCKFSDCSHDNDLPENSGCAVQAAISSGELELRRLSSFQKLQREDALNSATLAQRREKDKQFGKMVRSVMNEKKKEKKR